MRNKESCPSLICGDERKRASDYRAYDVVVPQETFEQLGRVKPPKNADINVSIYPHGNPRKLDLVFNNGPKAVKSWLQDHGEDAYLVNQNPWTRPYHAAIDQRAVCRRNEYLDWVKRAVKLATQLDKQGKLTTLDKLLLDRMETHKLSLESGGGADEFSRIAVEEFAIRELAPRRQGDMVNALVEAVKKEILKWFAGARGTRTNKLLPDLDTVIDSKTMAAMQLGIELEAPYVTFNGALKGQDAGNRIRYLWTKRVIGMTHLKIQQLLEEQLAIEGEATYSPPSLSGTRPITQIVLPTAPVEISPSNVEVKAYLELKGDDSKGGLRVSGYGNFVRRSREDNSGWSYEINNIGLADKAPKSANARRQRRSPMAQSG